MSTEERRAVDKDTVKRSPHASELERGAIVTTRDVKLNGLKLVFQDEGRGDPFVFFHGSMGSAV